MNWREHIRQRLSDGNWISLRELFDEVELTIPLHHAYRRAHLEGRTESSMFDARLRLFVNFISRFSLETFPRSSNNKQRYSYLETSIRLPRVTAANNRVFWARLRELRT
jgi:hypothetical protein